MTNISQALLVIEEAMAQLGELELPLPAHRFLEAALSCLNGAYETLDALQKKDRA